MLLFIEMNPCPSVRIAIFQYISCYCLSNNPTSFLIPFFDFNTSHVTVYHSLEYRLSYPVHYFNTSHVTVYQNDPAGARQRHAFQYISCYCLSKGSLWNIPTKQHFNTSHVTVYLLDQNATYFHSKFQYISCYCLSLSRLLLLRAS